MDIIFHISADFACVYLLNGVFVEKPQGFRYKENEPLYITVLPLNAQHLPFTSKVLYNRALTNEPLTRVYTLQNNNILIKLQPRYNYVYSPSNSDYFVPSGAIEKFFYHVKQNNLIEARKFMTYDLSSSIDDESLFGFFEEFSDIVKDTFSKNRQTRYYLIDSHNNGVLYEFNIINNLIDDMSQVD